MGCMVHVEVNDSEWDAGRGGIRDGMSLDELFVVMPEAVMLPEGEALTAIVNGYRGIEHNHKCLTCLGRSRMQA